MAIVSCKECSKEVSNEAEICPHCGVRLKEREMIKRGRDLGVALIAVPMIGIILLIYWVGSMNLLQNPGAHLNEVVIGVILVTAILAAVESNCALNKTNVKMDSPIAVFFAILLLWAICYPYYLYRRKNFGYRNLIVLGIFLVIIFVGIAYLQNEAINEMILKIKRMAF